jgi:hypothetical protein
VEVIGYVARFLAHSNASSTGLFVVNTLCTLVAPALFAASIYMVLGRIIILLHGEVPSPIRPSWLTKIFVTGDILSFFVQVAGAAILASNFNTGKAIVLFGLAAQIVYFGGFVVTGAIFHARITRQPTAEAARLDAMADRISEWRFVLRVVYAVSSMIFVRSVFRLAEFAGGSSSPLMTHEVVLYLVDAWPMLFVMFILILLHPEILLPPGHVVPGKKQSVVSQDEELI